MPRPLSWRKALALPAVLSLALGSALIAAGPAAAAPADLVVTSPAPGATLESRTVLFAGAGTEDSVITVVDAGGAVLPGTDPVTVDAGAWSVTATFADDADVAQNVTVVQTTAGVADGETPVSFTLPAAVPPTEVEFSVTAPAGTALESRAVLFEGTGTDGATVTIVDAMATVLAEDIVVVDGAWSTTVTYADDAPVAQTATVTQTVDGEATGIQTVAFELPAAVEPVPGDGENVEFAIITPTEGEELTSFDVVISGTGTSGSIVELVDAATDVPLLVDSPILVVDGEWSATVTYPADAFFIQDVYATQTTEGEPNGDAYTYFFLPYELVDAPTITSPEQDETVVGDQVTFTGTGEPGANVLLLVIPTELLEELEEDLADELVAANSRVAAAAEPADPEDPIVVAEDGTWSVTLALEPDEYTAAAILIDDAESGFPISEPSNEVSFSLVAAVAADGPGAGPGAGADAGDGEGLAVTGSESTGFLGLAALLLVAGAALIVANRRASRVETARVE
ncbi:hypothetical protein ELQ92_14225 [Labedella populi]|uniref:LPXTG cell wall anchor domain-containing protein n=1 Tax=Labedella populi TaxID=2498850 RepID=A0A444Q3N2_9MICO|nr:hypothetical protein [Labedella populi]RWZ58459.1 hypothetical protein ELQ92_14225 [Labedella populi]